MQVQIQARNTGEGNDVQIRHDPEADVLLLVLRDQESARQRKEIETALPLSVSRLCLSSLDCPPLSPGYVARCCPCFDKLSTNGFYSACSPAPFALSVA